MRRFRNPLVFLLAPWLALVGLGCGQTQMVRANTQIRDLMFLGNYPGALAALQKSKTEKGYKEQDRVVFWMNEGMLLYLTARYKEAQAALDKAEQRAKELFTTSISKTMTAAITSDAAKDYAGESYENVLVNIVKAFSQLAQNNFEGAMVEARRVNEKLALYKTNAGTNKNRYNQDAFAHWLIGLLFEVEGSTDEARIAYERAMEAYKTDYAVNFGTPPPPWLAEDMVRAAILAKDTERVEKWKKEYGEHLGKSAEQLKTMGEVILVHLNGEGPTKSDYWVQCVVNTKTKNWFCDGEPGDERFKKTTITIPNDKDTTVIKVAFPMLNLHEPRGQLAELVVGTEVGKSYIGEPVNAIAVKALADRMGKVWRDAIIRVVTKTIAQIAAQKTGEAAGGGGGGGALLGWAMKSATSATLQAFEEADKRAWTTLPARIEVARVWAPPGVHNVQVRVPGGRSATIPGVKVVAGKRVLVTYYSLP
jgi:uncharacterized protein